MSCAFRTSSGSLPRAAGRKDSCDRGFTIVELMVACAITAVIAGMMISITSGMLSAWNRSRAGLTQQNEIRIVQARLTRDLEGAVFRADGGVWLAATVQPDQNFGFQSGAFRGDVGGTSLPNWSATNLKPGWAGPGDADSSLDLDPLSERFEDSRFGMAGMWLRFFSVPTDNAAPEGGSPELKDLSAIRAIAYQIVRARITPESNAPVRYCLVRSEVRPFHNGSSDPDEPAWALPYRSTFFIGYDLENDAYNFPESSIAVPSPVNSISNQSGEGEPGGLRRPDRDQIVAINVIDFGLRFHGRNSDGSAWIYPAVQADLAFLVSSEPTRLPAGSAYAYTAFETEVGMPEEAEILLRVLTEEGAVQLERFEAGAGEFVAGMTWWELARQHSRVVTWRVPLRGHGGRLLP